MIFDEILKNILKYVSNDVKFIILLIIGIFLLNIKNIKNLITQSEKFFINTQEGNLKKLNEIRSALIQLSLEPFSKSKSKELHKLLSSNAYIINIKADSELQKNLYQNYTKSKTLNEELILNYTIAVQKKIKEINNIITKNNSTYSEFKSKPIRFCIKKSLPTICIVFVILAIRYFAMFIYKF